MIFFTNRIVNSDVFLYKSDIMLRVDRDPGHPHIWGEGFSRKAFDLLAAQGHWWAVLEFIEFTLDMPSALVGWKYQYPAMTILEKDRPREQLISSLNWTLNKMNVGYRLMPTNKFISVHSDDEAEEIGKACSGPFASARTHMENAVADFRNTNQPNHANTVKEAISAVESIVTELTGKEIRSGLHQLAKEGILPDVQTDFGGENSFVAALEKYWIYANATSRHGRKKGVEPPDRDTARFLLVTCATLVNYITTRHLAAGKSS